MRYLIQATWLLILPLYALAQEKSLYLNPDNALGAKASAFFSEAMLIPLQTNKSSSFNNVSNFLVTPYHYIIFDASSNAVFLFDKNGVFLHKYKKKKYNISSIQYIRSKNALFVVSANKNYTIPQSRKQQLIQDPGHRDFSKYTNLDLIYLAPEKKYKAEKLPVPPQALNSIIYFNGNYIIENTHYNKYLKDTIAYHLGILSGNKVVTSYFPFLNIPKLATDYEDIDFSINTTLSDTAFLLQKDFDHTIYKLTPDSLYARYKFVFPAAQTMPADFLSMMFKNNIEFTSYKNKNNKAITGFYNIIEHGGFVFFSVWGGASEKNFLFNTTNNNLYDLGKVNSDSSIYFLPSKILTNISEQDEDHVYTRISSRDLLKEKASILSKNKELPAGIKAMLEGLNKFDNPIIIKLKTKADTKP